MDWLKNKKTAFHIHTSYSYDSRLAPAAVVDYFVEEGFDTIIITDHETISGAVEAAEYAEKNYPGKISVIIGEEIKTDIGDITGFPLSRKIGAGNFFDVTKEIKEQDAVVCLPHPFSSHDLSAIASAKYLDEIDFIEVFNARCSDAANESAVKLQMKFKKYPVIGSDAHVKEELANTYFIWDNDFSIKESLTLKTTKRYVRKSQLVKSIKRKDIPCLIKNMLLYCINH
ncbi:MAG: PHP domain-containing protein [bacterium]